MLMAGDILEARARDEEISVGDESEVPAQVGHSVTSHSTEFRKLFVRAAKDAIAEKLVKELEHQQTKQFADIQRPQVTPAASAKQPKRKRLVKLVLLLAVSTAAIWLATHGVLSHPAKYTGTIEAKEIPLASKVVGRIGRVLADEGQIVARNQSLVELELPELEARRNQLDSQIERYRAELLELRNGSRIEEIESARASAAQALLNWQMLHRGYRNEDKLKASEQTAQAAHELALFETGYRVEEIDQAKAVMQEKRTAFEWLQKERKRFTDLSNEGAVSTREADDIKAKCDGAEEAFFAAKRQYEKLVAGPRLDEIAASRAKFNYAHQNEQLIKAGPRSEEIDIAYQNYLQAKSNYELICKGPRPEKIRQAEAK
jgi:multidrug resistance efflux pump